MDQQQSQKSGVKSEAQKQDRARQGYDPIPPANPVGGAYGEHKRDTPNDQETALDQATEKRNKDV